MSEGSECNLLNTETHQPTMVLNAKSARHRMFTACVTWDAALQIERHLEALLSNGCCVRESNRSRSQMGVRPPNVEGFNELQSCCRTRLQRGYDCLYSRPLYLRQGELTFGQKKTLRQVVER